MNRRKKLPKILEKEEREKLLNTFNERYPTNQRDKTAIELMLNTGLRLSELTNLKWEYLNLTTGKIEVIEGKGAKDRIVYANDEILEKLKSWRDRQLEELKKRDVNNTEYVFTSLKGNKLDSGNFRRKIYTKAEKAGINKKVSPHTFRHTFATDLYKETKNIRLVQKALGHSDLSTTMIYTHIVDDELESAMKNLKK